MGSEEQHRMKVCTTAFLIFDSAFVFRVAKDQLLWDLRSPLDAGREE